VPKSYRISEDDLAELERLLPELCWQMAPVLENPEAAGRVRTQLRRCKTIISNVRWDYGPPEEVERV
jgi:hypothetical protein